MNQTNNQNGLKLKIKQKPPSTKVEGGLIIV